MPYDDEMPPGADTPSISSELERLTWKLIGAAIKVHRHLGPGLPEEAYHAATRIEWTHRGIPFESQKAVGVLYKGHRVARAKIDLYVAGKLVVEQKAVETLAPIQRLQVRTYIRIIGQPLGLLINFSMSVLKDGICRIIDTEHIN